MHRGFCMRSSARWFALALILLLAASISLAAQVGSSPPSPLAQSTVTRSTQDPGSQVRTADQGTPAKGADANRADTETNDLPVEKSKVHWRLGTISVGAGYSSGPYYPYGYYPFSPYGYYPGDWVYSSFAYPLWGPYPFYPAGSFAYNGGRGEIRLIAEPKQAEVYIDGAYAGTADRLKNMWLDPGAYDLTVSSKDRESFHQRIYILSGKSLKITAKLGSDLGKEKL